MDCITRIGLGTLLGISLLTGCGKGPSDGSAANPAAAAASSPPPATQAIAGAASDFLDAVIKGDTQRASARLTPQAMQRIIASGTQFQPPGLPTAEFRIGAIRTPSQNQAIVQCVLTDTAAEGGARSEEMCCLLRHVENDWRVSGIAYGTGANQPWTLSDFESGLTTSIPRQQMRNATGPQPSTMPAGRPSPLRTADPSPPAIVR
jgi:hypothetical protein